MKKPIVKMTKDQFDFISGLLAKECLAVVERKSFEYVFNKTVLETKHVYCSVEYNTIEYIVRAIDRGNLKVLNII